MTAPPGYKLVRERWYTFATVGLVVAIVGALALTAMFFLVRDTRQRQGKDRVVIQRISKSPCANLSVRECQAKLVTPKAVIDALRKAGLRASSIAAAPSRFGAASGRRAPAGQRSGRGHRGGRGGTRPPPASPVTPAAALPEPEPLPPSLAPRLPLVPPICIDATVTGVCVG